MPLMDPATPSRIERAIVLLALLGVILVLACQGCVAPGQVPAGPMGPLVWRVLDRHDAYVQADTTYTALDLRIHLRDAEILRTGFREAGYDPAEGAE